MIWNSDPLADITVLQRPSEISTIIKDGRVVDREASGFRQLPGEPPVPVRQYRVRPSWQFGCWSARGPPVRLRDKCGAHSTSVVRVGRARALLEIDQHGQLTELAIAVGPRVRISFAPAASLSPP